MKPQMIDIRERSRDELRTIREIHRQNDQDQLRFGLGEIKEKLSIDEQVGPQDVIKMAKAMKRKQFDEIHLNRLSNGFLQSNENIEAFTQVRDSINVIAKLLSGSDSTLKLTACECLCNMSLGNQFCCKRIAQLCGNYLLAHLTHTNPQLTKTCLWTLTNLSASDDETLQILLSQRILPTLLNFLDSSVDFDISEECCRTINVIVNKQIDLITYDDKVQVLKIILNCKTLTEAWKVNLCYRIIVCLEYKLEDKELIKRFLEFIINSFIETSCSDLSSDEVVLKIVFLIRIIGNYIAIYKDAQLFLIEYLIGRNLSLCAILNKLFSSNQNIFFKELIWLVGNLSKSMNYQVQNYIRNDKLIENLQILENSILS